MVRAYFVVITLLTFPYETIGYATEFHGLIIVPLDFNTKTKRLNSGVKHLSGMSVTA